MDRRSECNVLGLIVALMSLVHGQEALGHPLDEIGICHNSTVRVSVDEIQVEYILWFAEIPAFTERKLLDMDEDEKWSKGEKAEYASRLSSKVQPALRLELDGRRLDLRINNVSIPDDQLRLMSLTIDFELSAKIPRFAPGRHSLRYEDRTYPKQYGAVTARASWGPKLTPVFRPRPVTDEAERIDDAAFAQQDLLDIEEDALYAPPPPHRKLALDFVVEGEPVVAQSDGKEEGRVEAQAAMPDTEPSSAATRTATLTSVPFQRRSARRTRETKDRLRRLISSKDRGLGFWALALGASALLGAFHALEPGHGKTIVAAYLVGSRGTVWHAVLLGIVVTISHTASVMLLGVVLLYLQEYVAPDTVGPAITMLSGAIICAIGLYLLVVRAGHHTHSPGHDHHHGLGHTHAPEGQAHEHEHGHEHAHSSHEHDHAEAGNEHEGRLTMRTLIPLGISGGIVPCPPAIVALIFAFSVSRVGFGLAIILAFSLGLAVVLSAVGIAVVSLRGFANRFESTGPILRFLPVLSALVVMGLGFAVIVQGLVEAGVVTIRL